MSSENAIVQQTANETLDAVIDSLELVIGVLRLALAQQASQQQPQLPEDGDDGSSAVDEQFCLPLSGRAVRGLCLHLSNIKQAVEEGYAQNLK